MSTRRPRRMLALVLAGLVAALVAGAVVLSTSQSAARASLEVRFADRAIGSAALAESLFETAALTAARENRRRYGVRRLSPRVLADSAADNASTRYLVVVDAGGIVAAAPQTPAAVLRALRARPTYVRDVLGGRGHALSDIHADGLGGPTIAYAQGFTAEQGDRRVLVTGFDATVVFELLSGSLRGLPGLDRQRSFVVDAAGALVASAERGTRVGQVLAEPGLLARLAGGRRRGSSGGGRYFAADAIAGTTWTVVLTVPRSSLYAPVAGSNRWLPWLLFAAFAAAALSALEFVRRMLRGATRLARANAELAQASAIAVQRADELARSNDRLARANHELERSNEELERFAAIASHDLQEPLRKVQMFAERVTHDDGEQLSERGRDHLVRVVDAARRMQALIDGLLVFSRITTQVRPRTRVALGDIAAEVVDDLAAAIGESGATIRIGPLPSVPADALQMRQLLQNLIANAVRFRRDEVEPEVSVTGRVDGDVAEIEVRDNGIGFEPRYATRIFRVFERLHPRTAYPGTGIGLALCRRIVERHGGTITAAGRPGDGATFTVRLPMRPPSALAADGGAADDDREEGACRQRSARP